MAEAHGVAPHVAKLPEATNGCVLPPRRRAQDHRRHTGTLADLPLVTLIGIKLEQAARTRPGSTTIFVAAVKGHCTRQK